MKTAINMIIRNATLDDSKEILEIMGYYLKNTAVHFSYTAPDIDEFKESMINIMERYPFFVLEDNNNIKGFAYAKAFSDVPSYDWSCELTVYIDEETKGKGYGRKLYETLEENLKKMGVKNLYAYIAYTDREDEHLDDSSIRFHEKMRFKTIAKFSKCGYKFKKWYDTIWMEKIISNHESHPNEIRSYKDIN